MRHFQVSLQTGLFWTKCEVQKMYNIWHLQNWDLKKWGWNVLCRSSDQGDAEFIGCKIWVPGKSKYIGDDRSQWQIWIYLSNFLAFSFSHQMVSFYHIAWHHSRVDPWHLTLELRLWTVPLKNIDISYRNIDETCIVSTFWETKYWLTKLKLIVN